MECLQLFQHFSPDFTFTLLPEQLRLSSDLLDLTHALAGQMIFLGGKASSPEAGAQLSAQMLADGSAFRHFIDMVELQSTDIGAAVAAFAEPEAFHRPTATRTLTSDRAGFLSSMDCTQIGWAVQRLGAGRTHPGDPVSAHAGIEMHAKRGDPIAAGQPLVTLFTEDPTLLDEPEQMLRDTLAITAEPSNQIPLIREIVMKGGS
jgi:pyrimidine-nucleoside phosphorylase